MLSSHQSLNMQRLGRILICACILLIALPLFAFSQDAKSSMDQLFPARVTGLLQTNASWSYNQTALHADLDVIHGSLPMLSKIAYYGNEERVVQMEILFADSRYINLAKKYHKNRSVTSQEILLRMSKSLLGKRNISELLDFEQVNGNYSGLMTGDIGRKAVAFRFLNDQSIVVASAEIRNSANDNNALEMVSGFIQALNTARMGEVMNSVEDYYNPQFRIIEELGSFSSLPLQMVFTEDHSLERIGQFFETQLVFSENEEEIEKEDGEMLILMANVACNSTFFNTRSQMHALMGYFDSSTVTGQGQSGWTVHKLENASGLNSHLIYFESDKNNYLFMASAGAMSVTEMERQINFVNVQASRSLSIPCR